MKDKQTKKLGFHAHINCMVVWLSPGFLWDSERLHGKKQPGPNTLEKCPISNSNQLVLTIVWNVRLTTTTDKGAIGTGNETCHRSQSWFTWPVFVQFLLRIKTWWLMKVCFGSQEGLFSYINTIPHTGTDSRYLVRFLHGDICCGSKWRKMLFQQKDWTHSQIWYFFTDYSTVQNTQTTQ